MNSKGCVNFFTKMPRVEKAVVYGSRAKGCNRRFSDVDLTLMGQDLTRQDLRNVVNEIDDLLLPYEFDLSLFSQLTNDALIDHIKRVGKTIYEKS